MQSKVVTLQEAVEAFKDEQTILFGIGTDSLPQKKSFPVFFRKESKI